MITTARLGEMQQENPVSPMNAGYSEAGITEVLSDTFSITSRGLYSLKTSRYFRPEQVLVLQIAQSAKELDSTRQYFVETADGLRGTLIAPHCPADEACVRTFVAEVEANRQQLVRHRRTDS
jgi:hypothetical protein